MPVLDAKALKIDPQGAAFLLSVLRQPSARRSKDRPKPEDAPKATRLPRVIRRLRESAPGSL